MPNCITLDYVRELYHDDLDYQNEVGKRRPPVHAGGSLLAGSATPPLGVRC